MGHFSSDDGDYPLWGTSMRSGADDDRLSALRGWRRHARRSGRGDPATPPAATIQLAAIFRILNLVCGRTPGWPWTDEMIALALHKGNISWSCRGGADKFPRCRC